MISAPFRFDATTHTYTDSRGEVPHITGLLAAAGEIDDTWYTEESCDRGRAVHQLTAEYDLGALDPGDCVSPFRAYLLGHVACDLVLGPRWLWIETPAVHPTLRFGGRNDRSGYVFKAGSVLEVKSGAPAKCHQVQTALQAILAAPTFGLPPEALVRYAEYVDERGRYKLHEHKSPRDFRRAYEILRRYA